MADQQRLSRALQRDSHDLSLSPRNVTRDSLVTNMLMSLDQFSVIPSSSSAQYPDDEPESPRFFDIPRYRPADRDDDDDQDGDRDLDTLGPAHASTWPDAPHHHSSSHRHHHHAQPSYSSDLDLPTDEDSPRAHLYSRQRRSNSSTTYQDAIYAQARSHRQPPPRTRDNHIRGGRGSRSSRGSSITSLDQGITPQAPVSSSAAAAQRWNRERGLGRSSSFDLDPPPPPLAQTQSASRYQQPNTPHIQHPLLEDVPQSPFQADFSFLNEEFDAAPTPTIPSGPRKTPSTPSMLPDPAERPSTRAQSSGRSVKSSSGRSRVATARDIPPSPMPPTPITPVAIPSTPMAADLESAPAPNVGYGKPKDPSASAIQKDRPGFFKRVFGGGSSSRSSLVPAATAPDSRRPSRLDSVDASSDAASIAGKPQQVQQVQYQQQKPSAAPPSRDAMTSHANPPPLQKKTSSFFRRRKKSTPDDAPPLPYTSPADAPPMPAVSNEQEQDNGFLSKPNNDSPASSLRHAMTPFLNDSSNSTPAHQQSKPSGPLSDITNTAPQSSNEGGYRREFSPDYEPSPNARIRKVQSNLENDSALATPTKSPGSERAGSFLDLDGGSDNDDQSTPVAQQTPIEDRDVGSAKPSSGSTSKRPPKTTYSTLPRERKSTGNLRTKRSSDAASKLALPLEGTRRSGSTSPRSPSSATPSVRLDTSASDAQLAKSAKEQASREPAHKHQPLDEPEFVVGEPTEDDRQKAQNIFDGVEDFIQKEKAAAWMGEEGPVRQRTLQAYMGLYNFEEQSIVYALRQVCCRLVLKAETQQVDRILVAFSKRWCDCNPNHGFRATGMVIPDSSHPSSDADICMHMRGPAG